MVSLIEFFLLSFCPWGKILMLSILATRFSGLEDKVAQVICFLYFSLWPSPFLSSTGFSLLFYYSLEMSLSCFFSMCTCLFLLLLLGRWAFGSPSPPAYWCHLPFLIFNVRFRNLKMDICKAFWVEGFVFESW